MVGVPAEPPFGPAVTVEALACTVGLCVAGGRDRRRLLRLASWQAQEVAAELEEWTHHLSGDRSRRCGWRTDDGDLLIVAAVSMDGAHLISSCDEQLEQWELTEDEMDLVADDLRSACELVAQLTEGELVRAAIEGWA